MATPVAYGGSQARGQIRAAAEAYATTTTRAALDLSNICDLHQGSWQYWILNPLSGSSDQTHILTETMSGS